MRFMLADNQKLFRDGMRSHVSRLNPALIIEAGSFDEAVSVAKHAGGADVVLLGQDMPGMQGIAGMQAFQNHFPDARIVLMIPSDDTNTAIAAIAAGAAGVITKDISGDGLLNAMRMVVAGEIYLPAGMTVAIVQRMVFPPRHATPPLASVRFSPGESEVTPLLTEGLANKVIAQRLHIEEAAVKARLRCIYKKLGVANRAQAVRALLGASQ